MQKKKPESRWTMIISVILSLAAIAVSFKSCAISKKALSLSKTSYITNSRPYLIVSSHKPKDRDSFITLIPTSEGMVVEVWFTIENKGNTPAYEVRVDDAKIKLKFVNDSGIDVTDNMQLNLQLPDMMTIGPHHIIDLAARLVVSGVKNQDYMREDNMGATLPVEVIISYAGVFGDETVRYTSPYKADLSRDRARIVKSDMLSNNKKESD